MYERLAAHDGEDIQKLQEKLEKEVEKNKNLIDSKEMQKVRDDLKFALE